MMNIVPYESQFEALVRTYQREIINFHYRFVNNRFEAEDLAQETFIKAYLKLQTLQDKSKLRSWLYQIARNTVIDFFRKNKKRMQDIVLDNTLLANIGEASAVDARQEVLERELSRAMSDCLDLLDTDDRKIVRMLYYEGFSYEEIADLMSINLNTLKSRLHRARRLLYEIMQANTLIKTVAFQTF